MGASIDINGLGKTYQTPNGPTVMVENFDLQIFSGECVSLLGRNGCGKSTVLTMVAGLNAITVGDVHVDGQGIDGPGPDRCVLFQSPCLLPWKSVSGSFRSFVSHRFADQCDSDTEAMIEDILRRVGLYDKRDAIVSQLSPVEQQRLSIARTIALKPKVLFLDDPFGLLPAVQRWELLAMLSQMQSEHETTILMVTSDIDEVLFMSDRVVLMTSGPRATIEQTMNIDLPRPRSRGPVGKDARYHQLRNRIAEFLR